MTTEQKIYNTAAKDGMPTKLAEAMVYQSQVETGNYTHPFFTKGNNAFGYSYDKKSKWQLDKGGPNADNGVAIAQYASIENSVHELTDWIKRRQSEGVFPKDLSTITGPEQYAEYLKDGGYYQDTLSGYASKMMRYLNAAVKNFAARVVKNPDMPILIVAGTFILSYGIFLFVNRKKIK